MAKRKGQNKISWTYKRGVFGRYKNQKSIPIDFLTTSFDSSKWADLSYASEINTDYNFELLIQRDIDKDRAIGGISKYLDPEVNNNADEIKKEVKFLPPIIAAIVDVDSNGNLNSYYPNPDILKDMENGDRTISKTWGSCFGIRFYEDEDGAEGIFNGDYSNVKVDLEQAQIKLNLGRERNSGARLVVIDGQHRLYALRHLAKQNPDAVKDIHLPVCIIYCPESHKGNINNGGIPKVFEVLRSLFIDINHTVERVSGHFFVLLSDQSLAGSICRKFCSAVLNSEKYGKEGLGMIEWNIKSDKESKVISRPQSLTSIGVISEAFDNHFKNKKNRDVLANMLDMDVQDLEELYEKGQSSNETNMSRTLFPWKDFDFEQKNELEKKCEKTIAAQLMRIFFESNPYKLMFEAYYSVLKSEIIAVSEKKLGLSEKYLAVRDRIFSFQPILKDENELREVYKGFISKVSTEYKVKIPNSYVLSKTVFQKGMFYTWFELCKRLLKKLSLDDATTILIKLLEKATISDSEVFSNTDEHLFLQNTVFNGVKIDASNESAKQISRLLLAQLGDNKTTKTIVSGLDYDGNKEIIIEALVLVGITSAGNFVDSMFKRRIGYLKKHYPADYSLASEIRDQLREAEEALNAGIEGKSYEELDTEFKTLLWENIKDDYLLAKGQLDECLCFITRKVEYEEDCEYESE